MNTGELTQAEAVELASKIDKNNVDAIAALLMQLSHIDPKTGVYRTVRIQSDARCTARSLPTL